MMKIFTTVILASALLCGSSSSVLAWGGHFHYRDGHYYRVGWLGLGGFVTGLAIGSYIASLPPDYETVVIGGVPYYYADGYYYQIGPGGYQVVAPPPNAAEDPGGPPGDNHTMMYILGTLAGVLLILCIIFVFRRILIK